MGGHHRHARVAAAGSQDRRRPSGILPPLPHHHDRADQRPHHGVAEGVGDDPGSQDSVLRPPGPGELDQPADGRRTGPGSTERREVGQPDELSGGLLHCPEVERSSPGHGVETSQGVDLVRAIAQAIAVAAVDRREASVEIRGGQHDPVHHDVGGQDAAQASAQDHTGFRVIPTGHRGPGGAWEVTMDDRATGVHPRVGASGGDDRWGGLQS